MERENVRECVVELFGLLDYGGEDAEMLRKMTALMRWRRRLFRGCPGR